MEYIETGDGNALTKITDIKSSTFRKSENITTILEIKESQTIDPTILNNEGNDTNNDSNTVSNNSNNTNNSNNSNNSNDSNNNINNNNCNSIDAPITFNNNPSNVNSDTDIEYNSKEFKNYGQKITLHNDADLVKVYSNSDYLNKSTSVTPNPNDIQFDIKAHLQANKCQHRMNILCKIILILFIIIISYIAGYITRDQQIC